MTDERVQPGCEVSKDEYERFKEFVREAHGTIRGNLGSELENAMREYRQAQTGPDELVRIENDIADIKAMIAETESDGGRTPSPADHTRTRRSPIDDDPDDRPAANAPTGQKVEYLVDRVLDDRPGTPADLAVRHETIADIVVDEYAFEPRTTERYVDLVVDDLDLREHPNTADMPSTLYLGHEAYADVIEDVRDDADDALDALDAGRE